MNRKFIYLIFGILLITLRLIFNFRYELIPGINGGYYPLQVRTLLNEGHLGFSDMPLYFFLNVFFVKIASFFTATDIDRLIIQTSKIIDSISLPFLVIPLYLINKNIFQNKLPKYFEIFLTGYSTLSFSPLILTSDFQKNAFAIPLMFFFIYFLLLFYKNKSAKHLILSVIFIILTGLTHFGVFSVSLLILLISLIVFYRKKALLPILGTLTLGILLVYLFDSNRAYRIFSFWEIIFVKPAIRQNPLLTMGLSNYVLSYLLIGLGIFHLTKHKPALNKYTAKVLMIFLITLFILSYPFLDNEYAKRFVLFLFIPQTIILLILFRFFNLKERILIGIFLVLMTSGSVFFMVRHPKPPSITQAAFQDLKHLERYISEPDKTLIIARHGLEWWVAWQLHTKVGQDKSLDRKTFSEYDKIISLVQLAGINQMNPERRIPFPEPYFPTNRKPVYVSRYFKAAELTKEDLKPIKRPTGNNMK